MRRCAPDHGAQGHHGPVPAGVHDFPHGKWYFECAGHPDEIDIILPDAMPYKGVPRTRHKPFGDERVEPAGHDGITARALNKISAEFTHEYVSRFREPDGREGILQPQGRSRTSRMYAIPCRGTAPCEGQDPRESGCRRPPFADLPDGAGDHRHHPGVCSVAPDSSAHECATTVHPHFRCTPAGSGLRHHVPRWPPARTECSNFPAHRPPGSCPATPDGPGSLPGPALSGRCHHGSGQDGCLPRQHHGRSWPRTCPAPDPVNGIRRAPVWDRSGGGI